METSATALKKDSIDITEPNCASKVPEEIRIELGTLNEGISERKPGNLTLTFPNASQGTMLQVDDNKPNYQRLKKTLDKTHARNKYNKPYGFFEACFKFNTGSHKILSTTAESDLDKFGSAMVLYFRFIKYLTIFFFIFAILSAPSLYFAIKAGENFGVNGVLDYKSWLYFTTLGAIGRGASHCAKAKIGDTVKFSCDNGRIGAGLQYGRILDTQDESCEVFSLFSWDEACNNDNQQSLKDAYVACEGLQSCQIQVTADFFDFSKPGCRQWDPNQNQKASFYLRALCDDVELELPGGKTVDKKTLGYIIASLDAAICVLYMLMLLLLKRLQSQTVVQIQGNVDAVDGYSIQVSNLPKVDKEKLKSDLWKHFSAITENGVRKTYDVVDVQLAEPQPKLDIKIQLEALKKKKARAYRRFYERWSKTAYKEGQKITYNDIYELTKSGNVKMAQGFRTISKMKEEQAKLKASLKSMKEAPADRAFVTFLTKKQRDDVYRQCKKSAIARFCYAFCGCFYTKKSNLFHGGSLKVKEAPAPNNIIWAHLNISKFEKALRRLVSWVITIGFWAISFAFIVFAKSEQQGVSKIVRPIQSCSEYVNVTPDQVRADNARGDEAQGLLECYCRVSIQRQLFDSICTDWTLQKFITNAVPFLVVVSIILTNYGLQYVFKRLSSFEKYQSISTESTSRIIKIFVAQLLNTGVIILIVNAKFTKNPVVSFLNGNYDDLIPEWYLNVGTTLLITMIINIVNLPVINTISWFLHGCAKCVDRSCTCNKKKTRKKTQEEWEELYTGPEFLVDFRYAQVLTVVSICFLYSAGLPLLYLSTFLNLFAVYWMDKIFFLKVCRIPKLFDANLEIVVRRALYACIFFHLIFAIWTYGNPQLFGDQESYNQAFELATEAKDIKFTYFLSSLWERAKERQNIVLSILVCIFVAIVLALIFFRSAIHKMLKICFGRRMNQLMHENAYKQRNYYECIHLEDLLLEKRYLEGERLDAKDEKLKEILENKLETVNKILKTRDPEEENHLKRFIGVFSYFVGHNPMYKKFFNNREAKTTNLITT